MQSDSGRVMVELAAGARVMHRSRVDLVSEAHTFLAGSVSFAPLITGPLPNRVCPTRALVCPTLWCYIILLASNSWRYDTPGSNGCTVNPTIGL